MKLLVLFAAAATFAFQSGGSLPVLWLDPGPIVQRDLFWGSGSEARAPQPPFTFVEENLKGTTPKIVVRDAAGQSWDVKFSSEAHAEDAPNPLLWAFGYPVEEMYYVHTGAVAGAEGLERAGSEIEDDGTFYEARFRRRDPNLNDTGEWALKANPFSGTRELSGLIILLALTNNWDTDATKNTEIFTFRQPDGTTRELYMASDLGASFGRFVQESPIKWNLEEYRKDKLIASVEPDAIVLNYRAYGTPPTRIPIEHARWFASMAKDLTRAQVRRAFEAAGTPADQIDGFVDVFMQKLGELTLSDAPSYTGRADLPSRGACSAAWC